MCLLHKNTNAVVEMDGFQVVVHPVGAFLVRPPIEAVHQPLEVLHGYARLPKPSLVIGTVGGVEVLDDVDASILEMREEGHEGDDLLPHLVPTVIDDDVQVSGFQHQTIEEGRICLVPDENSHALSLVLQAGGVNIGSEDGGLGEVLPPEGQ